MLAKRLNEFYSYAQYSEIENILSEFKVEFIDGIILINSANGYHQLCQSNIAYFLSTYFFSKKCQVMSEYKVEFIKKIYLYDNINNIFVGFKNNDILKSSVYSDLTIPLNDIFKF